MERHITDLIKKVKTYSQGLCSAFLYNCTAQLVWCLVFSVPTRCHRGRIQDVYGFLKKSFYIWGEGISRANPRVTWSCRGSSRFRCSVQCKKIILKKLMHHLASSLRKFDEYYFTFPGFWYRSHRQAYVLLILGYSNLYGRYHYYIHLILSLDYCLHSNYKIYVYHFQRGASNSKFLNYINKNLLPVFDKVCNVNFQIVNCDIF